uniref:SMP-LTD domain-containing protein n=1 Tax=Strigamia maritima TaxID=126957 RepID=T1JFI5_STRMM
MSGVNRKPKMTLAMLKGKPSTLSVPSIRFSSGDEDVEMSDKWNDEKTKKTNTSCGDISPNESAIKTRSTSMDDQNKESISLFQELKGKITKTVEEKLGLEVTEPPDIAEEATELLDGECPESRVASNRLKQISKEFRNRSARILNRGDLAPTQSWSMSQLADSNQDDDALEDRLNSEYRAQDNDESPSQDDYVMASSASDTPPPPSTPRVERAGEAGRAKTVSKMSLKMKWAGYMAGVVAVLWFVPLPPFITGLATGICLVVFCLVVHAKYIAPRPRFDEECEDDEHCEAARVWTAPPQVHKGWMNELRKVYDASDYHVAQTFPVLVRLEGTLLRISHPKTKIPRHASWNETVHEMAFSDQRYYNLTGSRVLLLPVGLTRKRLWSRKYPLCIVMSESANQKAHMDDESIDGATTSTISSNTSCDDCIYLFARTCREKEEWYWVLCTAANSCMPVAAVLEQGLDSYMAHWLADPTAAGGVNDHLAWLNALLSRVFWDFLRDPAWAEVLVARIQRKLSKLKLPYFMEELTVTSLELGSQLPAIERICGPTMDARGLWVDFDIDYCGSSPYTMTLETKLNLMKLKKDSEDLPSPVNVDAPKVAAFDSDEEDSAESSTDDETDEVAAEDSGVKLSKLATSQGGGATSKKILRFVDKISQSRYFQQATDFKYVRKAMEGVSNTRLILTVELQAICGTLAVNIPPPPTDRLWYDLDLLLLYSLTNNGMPDKMPSCLPCQTWYGFRTNPKISMVARPKLGDREVTVGSVTEWIEKKLIQEFQKILVMPNMDDFVIPIMTSGLSSTSPLGAQGESTSTI